MIPKKTIDQVREQTDLMDIVSEVVSLKGHGNRYTASCPFLDHDDKTPSFTVSVSRQTFKCFGCQRGGNVFTFLQEYHRMSFVEAVKYLANRLGIRIEYVAKDEMLDYLSELHDRASGLYESALADAVSHYFMCRGLLADVVKDFRLGYSADGFVSQLSEGMDSKVLEKSGLLYRKAGSLHPRFYDRYMFALMDISGRVIGFGGTDDDADPKYVNSPDTPLYAKSLFLYGLYQARESILKKKYAVVVEGYLDCLQMHQSGFTNTVAICGTALTAGHGKLLSRFADSVILMFDGDESGDKATGKAFASLYDHDLEVFVAECPRGEDPDSLLWGRQGGVRLDKSVVSDLLKSAKSWFDWKFSKDFSSVAVRSQAIKTVKEIYDDLQNEDRRAAMLALCSTKIGVPVVSFSHKTLEYQNRPASIPDLALERYSQIILLAAILADPEKGVDPELLDPGLHVFYERIKNARNASDLYNSLTADQAKLMAYIEVASGRSIDFDSALDQVKIESLSQEIEQVLDKIRQCEAAGDDCSKLTRTLNALLDRKQKVGA